MIWFTADTHFGHKNIIKYCQRPFTSVHDMNSTILDNINTCVHSNDTLYHLGDFSLGNAEKIRNRIRCKNIVMVLGNHDTLKPEFINLFRAVYTLTHIRLHNRYIILCHYAMRTWYKSGHNSLHLHGHSHGKLPQMPRSMDVGVDCHSFKPVSIKDVFDTLCV